MVAGVARIHDRPCREKKFRMNIRHIGQPYPQARDPLCDNGNMRRLTQQVRSQV